MSASLASSATNTSTNALTDLKEYLSADIGQVDACMLKMAGSYVPLVSDLSKYTMFAGGKRLRPLLCLAAARLCGYQGDAHIDLAASVECMHTATLLHDDVVDGSLMRRGRATANDQWGNKESVLVGDFLLGRAFDLMKAARSLQVYEILSHASMVISEGEVLQLTVQGDLSVPRETYFKVVEAKTSVLFAAACQVGAVIADAGDKKIEALRQYGYYLGMAFQIIDDTLDYAADVNALGKRIGDDFREGKVTLPLLIAYETASQEDQAFWQRTITKGEQTESDIITAIELIKHTGAAEASMAVANQFIEKARDSLTLFDHSELKDKLIAVLDFVIRRSF